MRSITYIFAISTTLILTSCGGVESKAESRAEAMCDCMQDAGVTDMSEIVLGSSFRRAMRMSNDKYTIDLPKCLLKVMKEMETDLQGLSKKEEKAYTKAFLKGCIDTDCADNLLDFVPYDELGKTIEQYERRIDRQEERMNERENREVEPVSPETESIEDLERMIEELEIER
jgi:hypothetical protein